MIPIKATVVPSGLIVIFVYSFQVVLYLIHIRTFILYQNYLPMKNERSDHQDWTTYLEGLYGYAYNLLQHKEDAEDAVARTYAKIYEKKDLQKVEDIKNYLYRSVHNTCMDMMRERQRREGVFVIGRDTVTGETLPDAPETVADHRIIRTEVMAALWRAVEAIPEKYRVIFIRHCLRGESFVSIAADLGLTPQTVSTRYQKAEDQLRIKFAGMNLLSWLLLVWLLRIFCQHFF